MKNKIEPAFLYLKINLISILILSIASFFQIYTLALQRKFLAISLKWNLAIWVIVVWLSFLFILTVLSLNKSKSNNLKKVPDSIIRALPNLGRFRIPVVFILVIIEVLILFLFGDYLSGKISQLVIIWIFAFILSFIIQSLRTKNGSISDWLISLIFSALIIAFINQIIVLFCSTTNYPFSLGWSEASRYYYASLYFSNKLYGFFVPFSPIHPSRYLIQSLPFLINDLPIWVHRVWQNLLWLWMPLIIGISILKRINLSSWFEKIFIVVWVFLFLFQGPFYYHLAPCAFIVILSYSPQKIKRTILFVILASIWAGISRINWIPVPGLLAAFLYLMESPYSGRLINYFKIPALFIIIGMISGFVAQFAYIPIAGYSNSDLFTSSFTSDLLWYRLLPNITFPMGILPAILIITIPVGIFVLYSINKRNTHNLRKSVIVLILVSLFIVGLIVSVKIGGGNNTHNFDAFLLFIMILAIYLYADKFKSEVSVKKIIQWKPKALLAIVLTLPILWGLPYAFSWTNYSSTEVDNTIIQINKVIEESAPQKKVLFISQRQLLTFGEIKNIPLIPEYEQTMLMEMAMSKNIKYLQNFTQDLSSHKYEIIVSFQQDTYIRDNRFSFPEESNAWNSRIAKRILANYKRLAIYPEFGIELLVPKTQ